ncbi:hypothetical protein O6H91_07G112600 [Diphasiastrum complanatum]|uniref:Uncharacterized protein n=1 Tax=Diphasiastrum complanatum TaxID=34168 RepID=A0ACC2D9A1_DIPCM|nr:hypothetical protein O6H91_07G112600 [Diphasiastrum complanatum]
MKGHCERMSQQWWRVIRLFFHNGSYRVKLVCGVLLVLAILWLANRASFIMGWHYDPNEPKLQGSRTCNGAHRYRYTVLLNTWKRDDLLKQSVAHYSSCKGVDAIRVIWSEIEPPSESLLLTLSASVFSSSKTLQRIPEFRVDLHDDDNLNNRFKPIEGLETEAVFSIDDDVIVPCPTLELAFSVWLSAPESMVGFVPRMHWTDSKRHDTSYRYGGWWSVWWTGTYSMVLTKAAFFHKKYLDLYTYHLPPTIREYVRSERNCEDIAMSFLIANATGAPPFWVKGRIYEIGSTGISSLTGHNHRRTHCLNYFSALFGRMPLVASNVKVVPAYQEWFW